MKKNFIFVAIIAATLFGISLDIPSYIVGGISVGFSLRWFVFIMDDFKQNKLSNKVISVIGYSLLLVMAGGIFELNKDESYLTIFSMMACAAIGIILAELVRNDCNYNQKDNG
ncbi:hypothetical protein DC915_RS01770 [Vibrio parahaemolyticus]|nr:hypothetical protein [Vibrio parahaemolyticus]EJG0009701.1 hypothetical protein [Vibrio parahaemolyticus]